MSNYQGRKPEFTPAVYTRYFERTETPKPSSDHIYFNEENEEISSSYQMKRDLIFKRLFPSKYAQSNDDPSESEQNHANRITNSLSNTAQSLGDFIPLSNTKKQSSMEPDLVLSSSDEQDDDSSVEGQLPTSFHESIVGHLHPPSTIENVRAVLIRELYQRTSDSHTEWLKCKMEVPREYINPKYYADFQRRYRKDIQKNSAKSNRSTPTKNRADTGYSAYNSTKADSTARDINTTLENDDIIETSFIKPVKTDPPSSSVTPPRKSSDRSKPTTEYIVLDTDEEDDIDDNLNADANSSYFVDRSSTSFTAASLPAAEDYHKEDSKYAQLPSRTSSSTSIIRPILSKHQRRKQNTANNPPKPLVSAIDRIIDHMDQSEGGLNDSRTIEAKNLLVKQIKKRKKKKKTKGSSKSAIVIE